jgi:hypothetical protein
VQRPGRLRADDEERTSSPAAGCGDGYRFAKSEGESIPADATNCLKTIGFRDFTAEAAASPSPSIHRVA